MNKKYEKGPKANFAFYILSHSLLTIFLVLLSNKTKPKNTSIPCNCIKSSNSFSMNFLETLDITKNCFLRCQLSYFALANIRLNRYDSFFRFILLLLGDINVNPGPTTVNDNKIPLNTLPFYKCDEPVMTSKCDSSDHNKEQCDSKLNMFTKRACIFYICMSIAYCL